jgi:WD40 repeat protein
VNRWGGPERHDLEPRSRLAALACGLFACACVAAPGRAPAADKPEVFAQLGHSNVVHALAFSVDGRLLASAGEDGAAKVWDLASERELRTLKVDASGINAIAFSPDGATLVTGGHDGTLVIFELASGRALHVLKGHTGAVNAVAVSGDGRLIASAGADHSVRLWDGTSGAPLRTLEGHRDGVLAVAFALDGRTLASGGLDKTIRIWDAASGGELKTLNGHSDRVSAVAFCPGSLVSGSWDHTLKTWDPASGRELGTLRGHTNEVWSVACAPDGRTLASGGYDHRIKLWDAASGHELRTLAPDKGWVEAVRFSPNGRRLASAGSDHAVKLWDVASGQPVAVLQGHADFVKSVAFSHNGKLIVSGSADHTVKLWRMADGRELRTITAHDSWVGPVLFSADNHAVVSRGGDGAINVWDIITGKKLRSLAAGNAGGGTASVALSADGQKLAAGVANNAVKLWNLADGAPLRTFTGHGAAVEAVAFAPDGTILASGDQRGAIKLWDVASGRELRTLSGHTSWVDALAFAPDGRTLASGSGDHSVRVWEVASGRELRALQGHAAPVTSVAFAPQGQLIASSDEADLIRLWDPASGRELKTLRGHTDLVEAVAFSPDGHVLASASADSTVRLWDVPGGEERLRLIAFSDGSTLEITPQGYYDFQGDAAEDYLNVRVGRQVSGIGAYREKFYRPDLVRMALTGEKLPASLPTIESVKPAPEVALLEVPPQVSSEALDLHVKITDRGGGIGEVRTFVNGSAVSDVAGRGIEVVGSAPAAADPGRILHLRLTPGANDIQVIAFSADGAVHSNPVHASVKATYAAAHGPQLYALVIGIQDFQNAKFDLKYSVADATAIAQLLQKRSAPLFEKVNVEQLTTAKATTKAAITAALGRYRTIEPSDVFVFYVASHGTVEGADLAKREYFLIPSNLDAATDEALHRDALSESELRQLIASIPATRKLLLLDTCHSGAMGDAMMVTTRGLEELAAVKVLSGAVGSTVLSASTSDEEALEGQDGHGLFTWVLLQGMGGEADLRKHGYVNTFDLADYVDDEVPRVAEEHFKRKQVPNLHNAGQSFQIVSSR